MTEYPWMPIARAEMGVKEVPGPGDNPRVVEYLQSTTLGTPDNENDETPWCSAFVNWCVEQAGYQGTGSAWAKSWLNWGQDAGEDGVYQGAIVVLSRGANSGHVGFFIDGNNDAVCLLGGNQGDQVCETWFPQSRVLGVRVPV